jgi:hypothetical protein
MFGAKNGTAVGRFGYPFQSGVSDYQCFAVSYALSTTPFQSYFEGQTRQRRANDADSATWHGEE